MKVLNFGVLFLPRFQFLDYVGPVDLIHMHSKAFLGGFPLANQTMVDKAPTINWHFISNDTNPVFSSSGAAQQPTTTYADCPPLDYLLVPGPAPMSPLPNGAGEFLQSRMPQLKALLTICTGSMVIARTGILDGHKVCSNKVALKLVANAGSLNKNVRWIGDRRWIVDGKVWSSAGITSGMDLAFEFTRTHFSPESVQLVKEVAEYEPKPAHPDDFAYLLKGVDL